MLHRLYETDNIFGPEVIERDNLFVPAGFDTPNLIEELVKGSLRGQDGSDLLYEDVMVEPQSNTQGSRALGKQ